MSQDTEKDKEAKRAEREETKPEPITIKVQPMKIKGKAPGR